MEAFVDRSGKTLGEDQFRAYNLAILIKRKKVTKETSWFHPKRDIELAFNLTKWAMVEQIVCKKLGVRKKTNSLADRCIRWCMCYYPYNYPSVLRQKKQLDKGFKWYKPIGKRMKNAFSVVKWEMAWQLTFSCPKTCKFCKRCKK